MITKSELKKILKTATMNVSFHGEGGYSATLQIEYTAAYYPAERELPRINSYCIGINESDYIKKEPNCFIDLPGHSGFYGASVYLKKEPNCFVNLPGQSGFYGAHAPTEVSLGSQPNDRCPVTAQNLFDLIKDVIQEKNLHFVSPECQLTQIWSALVILGVEQGPKTVNSTPYSVWYRLNKLALCVNCSAKIQGTKASGGDRTCAVCEAKSSALAVAV